MDTGSDVVEMLDIFEEMWVANGVGERMRAYVQQSVAEYEQELADDWERYEEGDPLVDEPQQTEASSDDISNYEYQALKEHWWSEVVGFVNDAIDAGNLVVDDVMTIGGEMAIMLRKPEHSGDLVWMCSGKLMSIHDILDDRPSDWYCDGI